MKMAPVHGSRLFYYINTLIQLSVSVKIKRISTRLMSLL